MKKLLLLTAFLVSCDYQYTPPYDSAKEDFLYNCHSIDKFSLTECEIAWQEKKTMEAQEFQARMAD